MTGVQTCALPICFPVTIGERGTAQYADKASEFWLQYRYGFLPLYMTVQDVIKQFNRDVKVWTRTAKRSSNTEDIELGTFTEYLPDDTGYWAIVTGRPPTAFILKVRHVCK